MISEKITVGAGTDYPLKGLLTLPDGPGPFPAVVLVHGSGSSNMDEKIYKLTPFKDLAEALAGHGIAAIRYDKRSYTHGLKMLRQGDITVRQETIEDALLATALLRADPRIDKDRVFLIGHSMGAMLAPRIDAEGGNYRGLILMAGTLRNLEDMLLAQNEEVIDELPKFLRPLMTKQTAKLKKTFEGLYQRSDEDAKSVKIGGGTTLYYFKEMGLHPAKDYLETFTRPLLILQGGKDFQVKADVDYAQYRALLEGRDNVTFRLYPELNHCFVPAIYTQISKAKQEYRPERRMSRDVTSDIARFILNN